MNVNTASVVLSALVASLGGIVGAIFRSLGTFADSKTKSGIESRSNDQQQNGFLESFKLIHTNSSGARAGLYFKIPQLLYYYNSSYCIFNYCKIV